LNDEIDTVPETLNQTEAVLAQLVERNLAKVEVKSSSLLYRSNFSFSLE
jgi:hypothetical protein